jgi:hypothetical protein
LGVVLRAKATGGATSRVVVLCWMVMS